MISSAVEDRIKADLMTRVKHITLHSQGQVTFQTICKEVERLKFVKRKGGLLAAEFPDEEMRKRKLSITLDSFFTTLKHFEAEYPEVSEEIIYTNDGLIPMIRIFGRVIRHENSR